MGKDFKIEGNAGETLQRLWGREDLVENAFAEEERRFPHREKADEYLKNDLWRKRFSENIKGVIDRKKKTWKGGNLLQKGDSQRELVAKSGESGLEISQNAFCKEKSRKRVEKVVRKSLRKGWFLKKIRGKEGEEEVVWKPPKSECFKEKSWKRGEEVVWKSLKKKPNQSTNINLKPATTTEVLAAEL